MAVKSDSSHQRGETSNCLSAGPKLSKAATGSRDHTKEGWISMNTKGVIGIVLLLFVWIIPARAQDSPIAPSDTGPSAATSRFNFDIGGGFGVPLNPTARFAGLSGTFEVGAGPNFSEHSSLVGEFMWQGLPADRRALAQIIGSLCPPMPTQNQTCPAASLSTSVNLYALTANYMYRLGGKRYGFYVIGGGGWYYRHAELKNVTVVPGTVCEPAWDWWGYTCTNGLVQTSNVLATHGVSSGGVNGGGGITINLTDSGFKFYIEARYHYSPQGGHISTQIVPVSLGFRW